MPVSDAPQRRHRRPTGQVIIRRWSERYATPHDVTATVLDRAGSIAGSYSFGQPIASYSVTLRNMPFIPDYLDQVEIALGYEGDNFPMFVGVIVDPQRQSFPRGGTIQCMDMAWLANFPIQEGKGVVVYDPDGNPVAAQTAGIVLTGPGGTPNNVPATEAMIRLLRDYGTVPEYRVQLPALNKSAGVPWVLGTLTPTTWSGVSPLQAAQEIADVLGYWLFADYTGVIRAVKMSAVPADQAWITFDEQATEGQADTAPIRVPGTTIGGSVEQVYNRVTCTGANTLIVAGQAFPVYDEYQIDIPLLPPGKYREKPYSSRLIEFVTIADGGDASCEAITRRQIIEYSRRPRLIRGTIGGDPRLMVGHTVGFRSDRFEDFVDIQHAFVQNIAVAWGGGQFTMNVLLDAGLPYSGEYTTLPNPTASFRFTLLRQNVDGVDTIDIFCESLPSSPDGGVLTAWAWTCATGTPASGSGMRWMTRVPYANASAVVSLTVTAASGKISPAYSQTIYFDGRAGQRLPQIRKLSYAAKTQWYATPDTGNTWRSSSGTVSVVPPIAAGGYADADSDDTASGILSNNAAVVRASIDMLATAALSRATLAGTPIRIWQNEKDPRRVWAVLGNALYASLDAGATFSTKASPPVPAVESDKATRWVVEAYDQFGTIDVLAGRFGFTAFDNGAGNYLTRLTGPTGSKAWCYASGHGKHWVGFLDMPTGGSPLRSYEGDIAPFPAVTPAVLHIRALTLMVNTPDMYAFDDQGRVWLINAITGTGATHVATIPGAPTNTINHAIRDGDFRLIYVAAKNGLYKYFPDVNQFVVFKAALSGEEGLMVGYAGLAEIVPAIDPTRPGAQPPVQAGTPTPAAVMPTMISTSAATIRVLDLGDNNPAPPAGWETAAFDHSAWPQALIQEIGWWSSYQGARLDSAWPIAQTAQYHFPVAHPGNNNVFLVWHQFTVTTLGSARLYLYGVEHINSVYVNGTLLSTPVAQLETGGRHDLTYDVPQSILTQGANNYLAVNFRNTTGYRVGVHYYMTGFALTEAAPPIAGDKVPTMAVDAVNGKTWYTYTEGTDVWLREGTLTSAPGAAIDIGDQGGVAGYYTAACVADRVTKLHMAWSDNGAAVRYRSRLASGGTLSTPVAVASGLTKAAQVDIGVNRSSVSQLAVLWRNLDTGLISVSRSDDAGATWGAPGAIASPASYGGVPRFARGTRDAFVFTAADGRVQLARWVSGAWLVETVSGADINFFQPSAVLMSDGRIAVAYRKIPGQVWLTVKGLDGLWTREIVDTDDEVAGPVAIGTDASGRIHVAWSGKVAGTWDVFLRTKTGSTWASVLTCSTGGTGYKVNVDLDVGAGDTGTRHVVWENWNVAPDVIAYTRV